MLKCVALSKASYETLWKRRLLIRHNGDRTCLQQAYIIESSRNNWAEATKHAAIRSWMPTGPRVTHSWLLAMRSAAPILNCDHNAERCAMGPIRHEPLNWSSIGEKKKSFLFLSSPLLGAKICLEAAVGGAGGNQETSLTSSDTEKSKNAKRHSNFSVLNSALCMEGYWVRWTAVIKTFRSSSAAEDY